MSNFLSHYSGSGADNLPPYIYTSQSFSLFVSEEVIPVNLGKEAYKN
jgi:hypothetical protein